jgi:NADH-quinone oxidoreductase subunit M
VAIALGAAPRRTAIWAGVFELLMAVFVLAFHSGASDEWHAYSLLVDARGPLGFGLSVGVDGLSALMVFLSSTVLLAAVWVSPIAGGRLYYASSLLIAAGAIGAFVTTDVIFFYAFHELALIPTFLMIGLYGSGERKAIAWRLVIYLGLGSLILLAGLVALVLHLGGDGSGGDLTFDMIELRQRALELGAVGAEAQAWIYLTLLVGFGILVALFPFHSWAAPAYASAPTATAMLHAGVLKKFGIYGLMRLGAPLLPEGSSAGWVLNILLILLLGNVLIVGLQTVAQRRLDRMVAYSSVMHMGYLFLAIAVATPEAFAGASLLMLGHGLSVALMFAFVGRIRDQVGVLDFRKLGGLAARVPVMYVMFGLGAFAALGLPGFANFSGEILIYLAAFQGAGELSAIQWGALLALWGVVLTAVYTLRAFRAMFHGEVVPGQEGLIDLRWVERFPYLLLIAILLLGGLFPGLFLQVLEPAIDALFGITIP